MTLLRSLENTGHRGSYTFAMQGDLLEFPSLASNGIGLFLVTVFNESVFPLGFSLRPNGEQKPYD